MNLSTEKEMTKLCLSEKSHDLISVVIPAYNSSLFIQETVHSALIQTVSGFNVEVIVTDDGSTDDTADLAKAACAIVIRKKNGGISSSRNAGLRHHRGQFVLFLDGDDRLRPGALYALMKALSVDLELGAVFAMAKDFISPELSVEEQAKLRPRNDPYYGLITGCMLIRRETMEQVGLFDETYETGEAVEWLTRMYDLGIKTSRIEYITADRRLHMTNTGRLRREQEKKDYAAILRQRMISRQKI